MADPIRRIAALYIDPTGPYPGMPSVDCWDKGRDAKLYDGPDPVVAHPPCGPWGRLKALCKYQDPECGLHAIAQVQAFGGVLEHPADSTLWKRYRLPTPGPAVDELGGYTLAVNQVAWGHSCVKPTWLYIVGLPKYIVEREILTTGTPTKRIGGGRRTSLPACSEKERLHSPPAFAQWLVSIARRCAK